MRSFWANGDGSAAPANGDGTGRGLDGEPGGDGGFRWARGFFFEAGGGLGDHPKPEEELSIYPILTGDGP